MFNTFRKPKHNIFSTKCSQLIIEPVKEQAMDIELAHDNKVIKIIKHKRPISDNIQYLPGEKLLLSLGKKNKTIKKIKNVKKKYNLGSFNKVNDIKVIENSMRNILKLF